VLSSAEKITAVRHLVKRHANHFNRLVRLSDQQNSATPSLQEQLDNILQHPD
jgi:hypothetical protein